MTKKKFLGIWGHLSWVCTMEVGTVLVGTGLLGTWVASQNQIPLWIYYSKSGHAENPEGRLTDLWKVVVMLAGGVCGGGEVPGGSVRRFLGTSAFLSYSSVFHMETRAREVLTDEIPLGRIYFADTIWLCSAHGEQLDIDPISWE